MEGEGPVVRVACAVGIRIAVNDVALAAAEAGVVDGDRAWREAIAAGVGDGRRHDAVGGDVGETVDGGLSASCGDGEVHRDDMVGVVPGVVGVIDRVGEGIYRVAASGAADEGGAGEREGAGVSAHNHGRCAGSKYVLCAVDDGIGVSHGSECHRRDGIDELPRIAVAGAVGVGVEVDHRAVSIGGEVHGRVAGVGDGGHFASAGVCERGGRGRGGFVGAGHGRRAGGGDGQGGQLDDVGVGPAVRMTCAVGEGVGIGHGAFAAGGVCADGRSVRSERMAAGVGDGRDKRCRGDGICQTADSVKTVGRGYDEVFGHHLVGVAPGVVGAVDGVGIDEGGVAAAVQEGAGVGAGVQVYALSAVGDDGQGGGKNFGETVDLQGVVRSGREAVRVEGVGVGPEGVVAGAVGVAVAEGDGAGAVEAEVGGAVHEDGDDGVAADVGDGVRRRSDDIHETRHGGSIVGRHVGDDVRHHDVEGEGPRGVFVSAICIGVSEGNSAFTI